MGEFPVKRNGPLDGDCRSRGSNALCLRAVGHVVALSAQPRFEVVRAGADHNGRREDCGCRSFT